MRYDDLGNPLPKDWGYEDIDYPDDIMSLSPRCTVFSVLIGKKGSEYMWTWSLPGYMDWGGWHGCFETAKEAVEGAIENMGLWEDPEFNEEDFDVGDF